MDSRTNSGIAVKDCIRTLSRVNSPFVHARAILTTHESAHGCGEMDFVFDRCNTTEYPTVRFHSINLMKGYGIPHEEFNPMFVDFGFDEINMTLRIVGKEYGFTLSNIRLVAESDSPVI